MELRKTLICEIYIKYSFKYVKVKQQQQQRDGQGRGRRSQEIWCRHPCKDYACPQNKDGIPSQHRQVLQGLISKWDRTFVADSKQQWWLHPDLLHLYLKRRWC